MDKLFRKDRLFSATSVTVPQHERNDSFDHDYSSMHTRDTVSNSSGRGATASFCTTTTTQPENIAGVPDPLGLQIIYSPETIEGDIVLVHGLGGSAWKTWSKDRQPSSFWPRWLAEDDAHLARFRLSTFGYNAKYKGSASNLNLLDFAKDLLFQLENILLPSDAPARPVIFISHSLGGLIVKKAFTLGKHDRQYERIISMVCGMIFLATPHRGSQYAKTLNSILATAPLGASSKHYINNLVERSDVLQEINESFRSHCDNLLLCSFYETLKTNLGLARNYVVEKYSAILGYDNESSASMDADHQTICKYNDKTDPNFVKIKAVLRNWASQVLVDSNLHTLPVQEDFLDNFTALSDAQIEDIIGVSMVELESIIPKGPVPCNLGNWLFNNVNFNTWLESNDSLQSKSFLLAGAPGTGKTTLSQSIYHRLVSRGFAVQYHRFDRTDQLRRTAAFCFRSIAAQVARIHADFKASLIALHQRTGLKFNNQNDTFQNIWERLFDGIFFKTRRTSPMIWILDGVDESDVPMQLLSRISSLQSQTPIRVLFISRPLRVLSDKQNITTHVIQTSDTYDDMVTFVSESVQSTLPGEKEIQAFVQTEILRKADGSFLWAKLVLEILQDNWHTIDDIKQALTDIPAGMMGMYSHMVGSIEEQSPRNCQMAKQILSWVTCSWRPLSVSELGEALKGDFGTFTNLALTITQICGHFIVLDHNNSDSPIASMVHITARDYLTTSQKSDSPWIETKLTHQLIAKSCLVYLSDETWRKHLGNLATASNISHHLEPLKPKNRLGQISKKFPMLAYSTWHWAYHLSKFGGTSQDILEALETFLLNYSMVWIEAIANSGNMTHLIRSAKYLKSYVKKNSKSARNDTNWIQLWAIDFIRIAGKYASNLLLVPSSVYRNVPALCPTKSMVGKTFNLPRNGSFAVAGILMETWEDCLASVLVADEEYATQIVASETQFFTVASSAGLVTLWSAETCEKTHDFCHEGPVSRAALNNSGTLLITSTYEKYYIWDTISLALLHCIFKSRDGAARIQDLTFDEKAQFAIAMYENLTVDKVNVESGEVESIPMNMYALEPEYFASPWWSSISPDCTKVAMAWRGRAPLFWDLEEMKPFKCRTRDSLDSLLYPEQLIWHPETGNLVILCNDTNLFEWKIFQDEVKSFPHVKARDMVMSKDGDLLLTSDSYGTLSVWAFPTLNLVYHLSNSGGRVTHMTFSPDSQRIYDVRGSSCNIWEPDALIRTADPENEENSSHPGSTVLTEPVISTSSKTGSAISAVDTLSNQAFYACGREDGTVSIHDAANGTRLRKVYTHAGKSKILHLCWSKKGKYLVSCDDTSLVVVKRLQLKEDGKWAVFPVMEKRVHAPIHQLLFSDDQKKLLINTTLKYMLWDMKEKQETHCLSHEDGQIGHWIPGLQGELFLVKNRDTFIYDWALKQNTPEPILDVIAQNDANSDDTDSSIPKQVAQRVVWSHAFNNNRNVVMALCNQEDFYSPWIREYNEITVFSLKDKSRGRSLPKDVSTQIKLLFIVIDDQVIFLAFDGWVCSIKLSPWISSKQATQPAVEIRRHFYIPKDWINTPAAQAAASNSQGTFFFPKQGEVAIVKNGLRF